LKSVSDDKWLKLERCPAACFSAFGESHATQSNAFFASLEHMLLVIEYIYDIVKVPASSCLKVVLLGSHRANRLGIACKFERLNYSF